MPPTVLCLTESEWSKAPPPAPPHASDCVLKPEYTIRNSWDAGQHGQSAAPLAGPQLGSCASSGRACGALAGSTHSQGEAGPMGAQPPPRVLELVASPPRPPIFPPLTIQAGESVEITFGAWEESGHLLRLYYWGQTSLQIEQPVHASIHSSAPHNQGYLVELKLGESCHAECRKVAPGGDLVTAKVACRRLIAAPKALPVAALERPERGLSAESLCNHSAHLLRPGATSQPPTLVRRRRGQTARELSPTSRHAASPNPSPNPTPTPTPTPNPTPNPYP